MSDAFTLATAVEPISPAAGDPDDRRRYRVEIHDGWDIGGNANGGYLLAIAARAMADATDRPPVTITCHYLRPAAPSAGEVVVDLVRSGRRFATATAQLRVDDAAVLQLVGTFGDQQPGGPIASLDGPVELPDYAVCHQRPDTAESPALMAKLASRIHPDDTGFSTGEPSGRPIVRGWFAFADESSGLIEHQPIDVFGLLLASDSFPPSVFNTELPVAWVPTVELTVHVRGVPAPGPLRCAFRSRFIQDGLVDEEGEIWDSTGHLVAQSRQLALLPRPPAT